MIIITRIFYNQIYITELNCKNPAKSNSKMHEETKNPGTNWTQNIPSFGLIDNCQKNLVAPKPFFCEWRGEEPGQINAEVSRIVPIIIFIFLGKIYRV